MEREDYYIFIQARMSSSRFPGKVLAPLKDKPIIAHLTERIIRVIPRSKIVVLTSKLKSDDPLACYIKSLRLKIFRGDLLNVFKRFKDCLHLYPCEWFFRISADSPVLDSRLIQKMYLYANQNLDLVTNVFPRTYPKGQSVEMVRTERFLQIKEELLTAEEKEHVTKVYYNYPQEFTILNIKAEYPITKYPNLAVDKIEDLCTIERYLDENEHYLDENGEVF